jgi:adenylosuccinate lyase
MRVYPERMRENLEATGGLIFSQRVLLELARRGIPRQTAYRMVQRNAMRFYEEGADFRTSLLADEELRGLMKPEELEACFDLGYHLAHVDDVFRSVFGAA